MRITMTSRPTAATSETAEGGAPPRPAVANPAGEEIRTREDSSTIVQFSDGAELSLKDDDLMFPTLVGSAISRIEVIAPPRHPALFAYWVPGIVGQTDSLAPGARRLARVAVGTPIELEHSTIPEQGATLALYSLALEETVGVIHLRPTAIVMRSCP